jgi:SAM-dependent methyltransferase
VSRAQEPAHEACHAGSAAFAKDGLARSVDLWRKFRAEASDPAALYRALAEDAVHQLQRHQSLRNCLVLDVGGGPGYLTEALARADARCVTVDVSHDELFLHGRHPGAAMVGDGCRLPVEDASVDACHSSNVLEHVPEPRALLTELVRVTRPGGVVYLSFTNWYSPWGGHETSPWHYLGGERAVGRYRRRVGQEPKNRYGTSLFPVHITSVLRWLHDDPSTDVVEAIPRYYPRWCRWLVAVPGLREVATWNLATVLRRSP